MAPFEATASDLLANFQLNEIIATKVVGATQIPNVEINGKTFAPTDVNALNPGNGVINRVDNLAISAQDFDRFREATEQTIKVLIAKMNNILADISVLSC